MKNREIKKPLKSLETHRCTHCGKEVTRRKSLCIQDTGQRMCRMHTNAQELSKTTKAAIIAQNARIHADTIRTAIKYVLKNGSFKYANNVFKNYCLGKGLVYTAG